MTTNANPVCVSPWRGQYIDGSRYSGIDGIPGPDEGRCDYGQHPDCPFQPRPQVVINLTPHEVTVRVEVEEGPDVVFPPSGQVARVEAVQTFCGVVAGIPVVRSVFGEPTNLPAEATGVTYLVSSLVAQAVTNREDVVAPDTGATSIRDEAGRIVAVRRFQRF